MSRMPKIQNVHYDVLLAIVLSMLNSFFVHVECSSFTSFDCACVCFIKENGLKEAGVEVKFECEENGLVRNASSK